jgi:ornithine lipid ester-linked acyl 2-hydroxylase
MAQVASPPSKRTFSRRIQRGVNGIFRRAEARGKIARSSAFDESFDDYPELRLFEESYDVIRDECLRLLDHRDRITDIKQLGGRYTAGGIHTINWKSFVLYAMGFVKENQSLCPRTSEVIGKIPRIHMAFFSILEPKQYITPHWGYYKGFLRFHLGVVIPNDNANSECWLRVNNRPDDNPWEKSERDRSRVVHGEKYYWRNGKGVIFDDTNLHDAANESDEVRVVLWVDICRKLPPSLDLFNRAFLGIAKHTSFVRKLRRNAVSYKPD